MFGKLLFIRFPLDESRSFIGFHDRRRATKRTQRGRFDFQKSENETNIGQNEHFSDQILPNPSWIYRFSRNRLIFESSQLHDGFIDFDVVTHDHDVLAELSRFPWTLFRKKFGMQLEIAKESVFQTLLANSAMCTGLDKDGQVGCGCVGNFWDAPTA